MHWATVQKQGPSWNLPVPKLKMISCWRHSWGCVTAIRSPPTFPTVFLLFQVFPYSLCECCVSLPVCSLCAPSFWGKLSLCSSDGHRTQFFLPRLPLFWDYRYRSPHLANLSTSLVPNSSRTFLSISLALCFYWTLSFIVMLNLWILHQSFTEDKDG